VRSERFAADRSKRNFIEVGCLREAIKSEMQQSRADGSLIVVGPQGTGLEKPLSSVCSVKGNKRCVCILVLKRDLEPQGRHIVVG
jgi:hypothetical protein